MRQLRFMALLLLLALGAQVVAKPKKVTVQPVYIFGFSASFTDSLAFLTDVMKIDSACVLSNGFLADRSLYSLQLENFVLGEHRVQNSTNAVYFSTKRKQIDKLYNKMNRKYQRSNNLMLIFVGEDEFKFKPVPYIDPDSYVGQTANQK